MYNINDLIAYKKLFFGVGGYHMPPTHHTDLCEPIVGQSDFIKSENTVVSEENNICC